MSCSCAADPPVSLEKERKIKKTKKNNKKKQQNVKCTVLNHEKF